MLVNRLLPNWRKQSRLLVKWTARSQSTVSNLDGEYDDVQHQVNEERQQSPVCSYNEWDTLEEVIVGRPQGARVPVLGPEVKATVSPKNWKYVAQQQGKPLAPERVSRAIQQSDEFCRVLELEGVKVRRPEVINWSQRENYKTPDFEEGGLHYTCPRDSLLVVGDEIIEAGMSWRSRYFETRPFKKLLNEYFQAGAKWTLAPKPTMTSDLYRKDYPYNDTEARIQWSKEGKFVLTEAEPAFDAADVTRCGLDIFVQISHTTNYSGYNWLKRHLGHTYRVHALNIEHPQAIHIDASFVPIRPGIWVTNPERPVQQADAIRRSGWDIVEAPVPVKTENNLYSSSWLSMNTLNIDEERIVVYSKEEVMIKFLKKLGMKPIPVDFTDCFIFGGAFHCWTVDIRRRGTLQSYFNW